MDIPAQLRASQASSVLVLLHVLYVCVFIYSRSAFLCWKGGFYKKCNNRETENEWRNRTKCNINLATLIHDASVYKVKCAK